MAALSTTELLNPMLHRALERRRMRRRARLFLAGWLVFGAIHIALWWIAFDSTGLHLPTGLIGLFVWPLLLASTGCFIGFLSYRIRRTVGDLSGPGSTEPASDPVLEPTARSATPGLRSDGSAATERPLLDYASGR